MKFIYTKFIVIIKMHLGPNKNTMSHLKRILHLHVPLDAALYRRFGNRYKLVGVSNTKPQVWLPTCTMLKTSACKRLRKYPRHLAAKQKPNVRIKNSSASAVCCIGWKSWLKPYRRVVHSNNCSRLLLVKCILNFNGNCKRIIYRGMALPQQLCHTLHNYVTLQLH